MRACVLLATFVSDNVELRQACVRASGYVSFRQCYTDTSLRACVFLATFVLDNVELRQACVRASGYVCFRQCCTETSVRACLRTLSPVTIILTNGPLHVLSTHHRHCVNLATDRASLNKSPPFSHLLVQASYDRLRYSSTSERSL